MKQGEICQVMEDMRNEAYYRKNIEVIKELAEKKILYQVMQNFRKMRWIYKKRRME